MTFQGACYVKNLKENSKKDLSSDPCQVQVRDLPAVSPLLDDY